MKIVIPGGSGQIGTILARHFHQQGNTVTVLSRVPKAAPWQVIRWDAQTVGSWTDALEQSDVCINLTGRSVDCRYLLPQSAEKSRVYARSSCFLEATGWRCGTFVDDRNRQFPAAHRI
jgi:NAD dependent epimerase/dehydratase family enzyme